MQQLLVVATGADALPGGVNRATRSFQQIPLGRAHFDDTKVTHMPAAPSQIAQRKSHRSDWLIIFVC